jgi:hypothetical protein
MQERLAPEYDDGRPLSSVLSTGALLRVHASESYPYMLETQQRPHYE